jgi:hypothetical protein
MTDVQRDSSDMRLSKTAKQSIIPSGEEEKRIDETMAWMAHTHRTLTMLWFDQ